MSRLRNVLFTHNFNDGEMVRKKGEDLTHKGVG